MDTFIREEVVATGVTVEEVMQFLPESDEGVQPSAPEDRPELLQTLPAVTDTDGGELLELRPMPKLPSPFAPAAIATAAPAATATPRSQVLLASDLTSVVTVDLCMLMDCTSSMGPWIRACALEVLQLEPKLPPNVNLRFAFVGYRDVNYAEADRYVELDFVPSSQIHHMQTRFDNISAMTAEGSDWCEDVAGGLCRTCDLSWQSKVRLVAHISDAPPHGAAFHSTQPDLDDLFPNGDPSGLDPCKLLTQLCRNGVDYTFFNIDDTTRDCQEVFQRTYKQAMAARSGHGQFRKIDITKRDTSRLAAILVDCITHSVNGHM